MSIWKCFCLPHRKPRLRNERGRKWQNMTNQPISAKSSSRSKLLQYNDREYLDHDVLTSRVEDDTWTRLESQPGVKKRRGLDEIFERPKSEMLKSSADPLDFKNVGYPTMFSGQLESMYGYTPRAVQDVYASSALEGGSIEDYFTDARNESVLKKFASAESCNGIADRDNTQVHSVRTRSDSRHKYMINSDGDYSSDSDMDDLDYCDTFPNIGFETTNDIFHVQPFPPTTNTATPYLCRSEDRNFQNQHFDEIFGSDEVLY
ncbi:hypothetical protein LOTGIDRAFT_238945 [Lottia gigantea]|uniref:Uncharacterized protein n=1 Tax=Lottia gigantea TaxID=225164 RepID=V4AZ49_LOTGI|nr:hypothetical protein LOTGIDRAFT_238945 [Lottia gigantea]ESO99001.1 hypothetical protein LOTGIDRAFT_238945 [Lottia gigantea]